MPGTVESHDLAAYAEEDRAALSGRPRKANAGQYVIVMPHRRQPAIVSPMPHAKKKAPRRFRRGALCFLKLSRQITE